MRVIFRAKQSMTVGVLFVGGMLTSAGCGSKTQGNPPGLSMTQKSETEQVGNTGGKIKTMQAPLSPGATGTPSDTFVKPGE